MISNQAASTSFSNDTVLWWTISRTSFSYQIGNSSFKLNKHRIICSLLIIIKGIKAQMQSTLPFPSSRNSCYSQDNVWGRCPISMKTSKGFLLPFLLPALPQALSGLKIPIALVLPRRNTVNIQEEQHWAWTLSWRLLLLIYQLLSIDQDDAIILGNVTLKRLFPITPWFWWRVSISFSPNRLSVQ